MLDSGVYGYYKVKKKLGGYRYCEIVWIKLNEE